MANKDKKERGVELKPCPFCGRGGQEVDAAIDFGPFYDEDEDYLIDYWFVECKCGGEVIADTKRKAAIRWNKRRALGYSNGEVK